MRPVWPCLALFGPVGPLWSVWLHFANLFCPVCPHLATFGCVLTCLAKFGRVWPSLGRQICYNICLQNIWKHACTIFNDIFKSFLRIYWLNFKNDNEWWMQKITLVIIILDFKIHIQNIWEQVYPIFNDITFENLLIEI